MQFVLTAQPIDERGMIGFEHPPPEAQGGVISESGDSLQLVFVRMADTLLHTEATPLQPGNAYDLTLEIHS